LTDANNDTPVVEELSDGQPDHCKPKHAAHSRRGWERRKAYKTTYGSKCL